MILFLFFVFIYQQINKKKCIKSLNLNKFSNSSSKPPYYSTMGKISLA